MKIRLFRTLILLSITMLAAAAQAQYEKGSALLIVNGGTQFLNPEGTEQSLDGFSGSVSYERTSWDGKWSGGFSLSYLSSQTKDDSSTSRTVNYSSVPLMMFVKYHFGSPKVRGFLRGSVGAHSSEVESSGQLAVVSDWDAGYLVGAGLGANFFMSKTMLVNAGYHFAYFSNSFYRDGLVHSLQLGIGFQFD
jgi:hypothetical protein